MYLKFYYNKLLLISICLFSAFSNAAIVNLSCADNSDWFRYYLITLNTDTKIAERTMQYRFMQDGCWTEYGECFSGAVLESERQKKIKFTEYNTNYYQIDHDLYQSTKVIINRAKPQNSKFWARWPTDGYIAENWRNFECMLIPGEIIDLKIDELKAKDDELKQKEEEKKSENIF